jgi:hypothetical protein
MTKRFRLSLALSLSIFPLALCAQEPRIVSVLGDREPGEVRLRLSAEQLESVGIPEIGYSEGDQAVADLAEVGLRVERFGARLDGEVKSALGRMAFRSTLLPDGRVRVEHDLPGRRGTLTLLVDRAARTAEPVYPSGVRLTASDRFVFRSLAMALSQKIGADASPEADLLLRAARLWGDHPLREVRLRKIVAPAEKSWTNLCGKTSSGLSHDATNHGLITETLAVGPKAYNCRSRCGAGCDALIGTSAWTRDCGEHDRCEQEHSCCTSCQDEFNSASDDYVFAPNCRLSGW